MSREMDAEVARLLGWKCLDYNQSAAREANWLWTNPNGEIDTVPHYTTDHAAVMQVVASHLFDGWKFWNTMSGQWVAQANAWLADPTEVVAETLPLAICRAALASLAAMKETDQ